MPVTSIFSFFLKYFLLIKDRSRHFIKVEIVVFEFGSVKKFLFGKD